MSPLCTPLAPKTEREEAIQHHVDNDRERDSEHETGSESEFDTDTEVEMQDKIEDNEWKRFKEMGMKWMHEEEVGTKLTRDMVIGRKQALKKVKENRRNRFLWIRDEEADDGRFPFMRDVDSKTLDEEIYANAEDEIEKGS